MRIEIHYNGDEKLKKLLKKYLDKWLIRLDFPKHLSLKIHVLKSMDCAAEITRRSWRYDNYKILLNGDYKTANDLEDTIIHELIHAKLAPLVADHNEFDEEPPTNSHEEGIVCSITYLLQELDRK